MTHSVPLRGLGGDVGQPVRWSLPPGSHRPFAHEFRLVALLLIPIICGCDSGDIDPNSFQISGEVTWEGQPVPVGFITFEPDSSQGNRGPAGGAEINKGRYETPPGRGIAGGDYIVRIRGYDGVPLENPDDIPSENGTPLFPETIVNVNFPAADTVRDFDLTDSGNNKNP